MKLEFEIKHQTAEGLGVNILKLLGNNELVEGSRNYVYAHFKFSSDWNGFLKTVIFQAEGVYFLTKVLDSNDCCLVPDELLNADGKFTINVTGKKDDVVITTNPMTIYVRGNGISPSLNTGAPDTDFLVESVATVTAVRDAVLQDKATTAQYRDEAAEHADRAKTEADRAANVAANVNVFIPEISENYDLSWTNAMGLPNPPTVNIKGAAPTRGKEYWNEEDIAAMHAYIDEQFAAIIIADEVEY